MIHLVVEQYGYAYEDSYENYIGYSESLAVAEIKARERMDKYKEFCLWGDSPNNRDVCPEQCPDYEEIFTYDYYNCDVVQVEALT